MPDARSEPKLEIAHVLTMDVVEYSTLLITEQSRIMAELTRVVKNTPRFRRAEAEGKLVRIPTGDGMLLVFFDDPQAPIECALEISLSQGIAGASAPDAVLLFRTQPLHFRERLKIYWNSRTRGLKQPDFQANAV